MYLLDLSVTQYILIHVSLICLHIVEKFHVFFSLVKGTHKNFNLKLQ